MTNSEEAEYKRKRDIITDASLFLEDYINNMLSRLLGVTASKSISFGTSNSSLPLNAKVNLLIDLGALNKEDQAKFQNFMGIRNKFLHLSSVKTFTHCFQLLGIEGFMKKHYPIHKNPKQVYGENEFAAQVGDLTLEVLEKTASIKQKLFDKVLVAAEQRSHAILVEYSTKNVPYIIKDLESSIDPLDIDKIKDCAKRLRQLKRLLNISKYENQSLRELD